VAQSAQVRGELTLHHASCGYVRHPELRADVLPDPLNECRGKNLSGGQLPQGPEAFILLLKAPHCSDKSAHIALQFRRYRGAGFDLGEVLVFEGAHKGLGSAGFKREVLGLEVFPGAGCLCDVGVQLRAAR